MTKIAGTNMKRTAAMLLCSVALAMPALAQSGFTSTGAQEQGPPPGGRRGASPEQQLATMQTELSLTPDQATKVKAILDDTAAQMKTIRDAGGTPEDNRPKMMAARQGGMEKIKALLTDDQKTKFDAMQARMRGGNGGPPPPPPPPPAAPQQ